MKLVVLGGGESGVGASVLGKKQGWEVFLSDKGKIAPKYQQELEENQIRWEQETHSETEILQADCIIKSPGIPDTADIIRKAKARNIEIISEIEFAYRYTNGKIIAITGSNGKTTTTRLTYQILKDAGFDVAIGGNIGESFARTVAQNDKPYYVLEISSFQLDGITSFQPHIAMLLNITPDHLDRYDYKMENYIASKFKIIENQTADDFFIYDADDPIIMHWLENNEIKAQKIPFSVSKSLSQGAFCLENQIKIINNSNIISMETNEINIKGTHNVKNSMAGATAAQLLNIRKESIRKSLGTFKGEPHRLEFVRQVDGVKYVNDSKATNVNSVYYALDTISVPIIWIVGGQDKGNDYGSLLPLVQAKVKAIICLGVDNRKIMDFFSSTEKTIVETKSMTDAVAIAKKLSSEGDTVLLSPACASFDLFNNYEHRGDLFKESVIKL